MTISYENNLILINGIRCELPWPILNATEEGEHVFVLLDPNIYLNDPEYLRMLRQASPSIKNLIAFDSDGNEKWKAEFPTEPDYYYQIVSITPLIADSFSSYRCKINSENGRIEKREFLK